MKRVLISILFAAIAATAQDTPTPTATPTITETPTATWDNTNGLALWWPFDGDTNDAVGDNDLSSNADAPTYVDGIAGSAIRMTSGISLTLADSDIGSLTRATIMMWLRKETAAETITVLASDSIDAIVDDDYNVYLTDTDGHIAAARSALSAASDTNWHHLAVTYSGSDWAMYLDGHNISSGNVTPWTELLAAFDGISVSGWDGWLDDVRLYGVMLSSTAISDIYDETQYDNTPTPTYTATITPTITPTPPLWPGLTPPYLDEWDAGDRYSGPKGRGPVATLTPTYNILPPGGVEY